jgi:hypothetical protein
LDLRTYAWKEHEKRFQAHGERGSPQEILGPGFPFGKRSQAMLYTQHKKNKNYFAASPHIF